MAWAMAADDVPVAVPSDVIEDYTAWLGQREATTIADFSGAHSQRDVVEVALFLQALNRGGYDQSVQLVSVPSYARLQEELRFARVAASANSMWMTDIFQLPNVAASGAVIADGQFEAGVYVRPEFTVADNVDDREDQVRALHFVCSPSWTSDWSTLQHLHVQVTSAPTWESMVLMIHQGNADAVLAPFQATADWSLTAFDQQLLPVPGVKVALRGSRHFAVAVQYPGGNALLTALNTGLASLLKDGTVQRAYQQSGFINPLVAQWAVLSPPPTPDKP